VDTTENNSNGSTEPGHVGVSLPVLGVGKAL
jgi:hypothetical protein